MSLLGFIGFIILGMIWHFVFSDYDKEKEMQNKQNKLINDQQKVIDALLKEKGIKNDTNR